MANNTELSPELSHSLHRQMHRMSIGLDALDGLGALLANTTDDEIPITNQQASSLLKCIELSLLTTQRETSALIND